MQAMLASILLVLAAAAGTVAEDIPIDWRITNYEDIDAMVGDNLVFTYEPFHTLFQVGDFSCNFNGSTQLGGTGDSPVTVPLEEEGLFFYACAIPGHCPSGMLLRVIVSRGAKGGNTILVGGDAGWQVMPYEDLTAQVGDKLVFSYPNGGHTVWQVTGSECNFNGGMELGGLDASPVTVELNEAGTFFYACNVPGHCAQGMLFAVTVTEPVAAPAKAAVIAAE